MADIIEWEDIVGDLQDPLQSGGYLGDLLTVARSHVDDLVKQQRLTQNNAGQVYSSMIQTCIQQAVAYSLQKDLSEEQVRVAYVERVIQDKKAVLVGIDGALNANKALKDTDTAYIYTPMYIRGVV